MPMTNSVLDHVIDFNQRRVPAELFDLGLNLSAAGLRVLLVILRDRLVGQRVRVTINRLSKNAGLSKRQCQRGVSELKKIELLRVAAIPKGKGSNEFVLNVDFLHGRLGENVKRDLKHRDKNVTQGGDKVVTAKSFIRRDRSVTWQGETGLAAEGEIYQPEPRGILRKLR